MSPELKILALNATCLGIAWLGLYPSLRPFSLSRLMATDAVVTVLALAASAGLFMGSGVRFWAPFSTTNWFAFWLLSYLVIETALFAALHRRLGLFNDKGADE